jgi:polyhydroxybutyrate depolymerase
MGKSTISLLVLVVLILALSAWLVLSPPAVPIPIPTGKYQAAGDYLESILVHDVERWFAVHLPPSYRPGKPLPLVINIHGRTGTMFQQEELAQMNAKADREGFVAVHPQALDDPPTWWGPIPNQVGQPDMDFFSQLLDHLQQEISIDPARIYATGFSNGATMANRLGCDMEDTFAAIAPVSGGHVAFDQCQVDRPVSVLIFHGRQDSMIPYGGGPTSPSVREWVLAWAERDGCDLDPTVDQLQANISRETWDDCEGDAVVVFYTVDDAGHTWPGSEFGSNMGGFTLDIEATDLIWDFFRSHPKK